jgi:hypothetical protein
VDLVMLRNFDETITVDAWRVGHDVSDMLAFGVWLSDHAGVVAWITTGG